MSDLRPIGDYAETFSRLELGLYLAKDPPAVLIQDVMKASFKAIVGQPGDTVDVILKADSDARKSGETKLDEIPRETAYMVVTLRSRLDPNETSLLIGSSAACDIIIPDESVSRQHARIERKGENHLLQDLTSTNGTAVDKKPLASGELCRLNPGSLITLGTTDMIFLDPTAFYHFVRQFLGV